MAIGILILRLAVGLTMAAHGTQKLFGWFGGYGLEKTGQFMEMLGFFPGRRNAFFAGLAECGGGLLLALGLITPVAGMLIFSVMVVAGVSTHLKNGFFITAGGYEYTLVLGLSGLSLSFIGGGSFSLDSMIGFELSGLYWGLGAFALGLVGSGIQLVGRKFPKSDTENSASKA